MSSNLRETMHLEKTSSYKDLTVLSFEYFHESALNLTFIFIPRVGVCNMRNVILYCTAD